MAYDAGSVESKLTLDRSPFQRELDQAKRDVREFTRRPYQASLRLDRTRFTDDVQAAKAQLRDLGRTEVKPKIRLDSAGMQAEIDRLNAKLDRLARDRLAVIRVDTRQADNAIRQTENRLRNDIPNAARKAQKDSEHSFSLMRTAIEFLLPPVVTVAGGVAGLAAALPALGIAGILAFKGVNAEIKKGTPLGLQYAAGLGVIKSDYLEISHTAAANAVDGFNQSITKAHAQLPAFNQQLAGSSRELGSITSHLVGGALGGFATFGPLIHEAEVDIDRFAGRFESWASGPGGTQFMNTLLTDLRAIGQPLGQLGTFGVHAISALNGTGLTLLTTFGRVAAVLSKLPVGVLQTLIDTYLVARTVIGVTAGINAAAGAWRKLAGAEAEATAAAGAAGARGAAGIGIGGRAARLGGLAVGGYLAANLGDQLTGNWQTDPNVTKRLIGQTFHTIDNIVTGHWSSIVGDLQKRNAEADRISSLQSGVNKALGATNLGILGPVNLSSAGIVNRTNLDQQYDPSRRGTAVGDTLAGQGSIGVSTAGAVAGGVGGTAKLAADAVSAARAVRSLTNAEVENATQGRTFASIVDRQRDALTQVDALARRQTVTSAAQGYTDLANNVQKSVTAQQKWLDQGGKTITTIDGMKIGENTLQAALDQTGQDYYKAVGLIKGRIGALQASKMEVAEAQQREANLAGAVEAAGKKYNLTGDEVSAFAQLMGISSTKVADGTITMGQFTREIGVADRAITQGSTSVQAWAAAVVQFRSGADTVATRAQLISAALVSFNGDAIQFGLSMAQAAGANQQFVTDFNAAKKSVVNLKTGFIDFHNAGAVPLLQDLQGLQGAAAAAAAAEYQHQVSIGNSKNAAKDAADVYYKDTKGALIDEHTQLGITRGEADKLAERYFHWPKDAKTQIEAMGATGTNKLLNAIGQQLAILTHHKWTFGVDATISPNALKAANLIQHDGGTYTLKHTGKGVQAAGGIFTAYAGGGLEDHRAALYKGSTRGLARVFHEPETKGEAYVPLANDWRRPRAQAIVAETASLLGGAAFFGDGGYTGVTGPSAPSSGSGGAGGTTSGPTNKHKGNATLNSLLIQATKERDWWDTARRLPQLAAASAASIAASVTRIQNTLNAARTAKAVPSSLVTQFAHDTKQLTAAVQARDRLAAKVKADDAKTKADQTTANQYGASVRDQFLGAFNIGTSGNGYKYGIQSSLEQATKDAQKFKKLRDRAKAMHLDPRLIQQLENQGAQGAANLETIVNSGQGFVNTIDKDYAQLYSASSAIGNEAKHDKYNKKIEADNAQAAKDRRALNEETRKVREDLGVVRDDVRVIRHDIRDAALAAKKKA